MALYIDGRFAVNGQESHLNLQNPINVTKEIRKEMSTLDIESNIVIVSSPANLNLNDNNEVGIFVVPNSFLGKELIGLEATCFGPVNEYVPFGISYINPSDPENTVTLCTIEFNNDSRIGTVVSDCDDLNIQPGAMFILFMMNAGQVSFPEDVQVILTFK